MGRDCEPRMKGGKADTTWERERSVLNEEKKKKKASLMKEASDDGKRPLRML